MLALEIKVMTKFCFFGQAVNDEVAINYFVSRNTLFVHIRVSIIAHLE
jgi:hypothetical protein